MGSKFKFSSLSALFAVAFLGLATPMHSAFASSGNSASGEPIYVSDVGFATPESVEYYAAEDVYLVANINGSPFDKDDNGFISKISPDGEVLELKWLDGAAANIALNAPKGMQIIGNRLLIADIDRVRVFELPSGKQLADIAVEGASFLNGVSIADQNSVYVTDMGVAPGFKGSGTDAIYQIGLDGQVSTLVKTTELNKPNGVAAHNGGVIIGTFGSGKLVFLDNKGATQSDMTLEGGRLDGLLSLEDGSIITSSWEASAVYRIASDKTVTTVVDGLESPADLGLDTKRNRVLIPLFKGNKLVIQPIK
ncbi:SMP-30/gluconolactonase/LRE family protein [Thiomicrorhabdus lithotrophica]|uniref:Sugar lactone lactonase YvrE n=1 Tax=Thiomicrorhabdus lithotrophica TaxID=2949997 RepID=A0ABY8CC16_9GAMM|nr:hypothetical protein [Thiomicrorhabdus lithotrophica]WEJ63533.1 hypothetical protein NR989_04580 [Thiomicrorhabdus lithotrophica]